MKSTNVVTPVATTSSPMSLARKIILAALLIHFVSLFLPYQDQGEQGGHTIAWNVGLPNQGMVYATTTVPEQTGFELKPYAAYLIIGLLIVFGTSLHQKPFWRRYGYGLSFALLLVFAFGGAIIRTSGGKLSLVSLGLVSLAALINWSAE